MKTTIFKGFVVVFAVSLVLQSCTKDFEKINTNPNDPALELALPKLLLPNVIENMTERTFEIFLGHEMGNCWVQHMAKVQYTDEDRYVPRSAVINNTWTSFYATSGMDNALLKKIATAQGLKNYRGVSLVLEAYITSVLTDLFGPVPYSEAWRSKAEDGGIISPAYDDQESIYRALIISLDTANNLLSEGTDELEGDLLYGGDPVAWQKFANSLRLRLILRMSAKDEAFATAELTKMLVTSAASYPVFESNDDNAQLFFLGSAPSNNPIAENRKTRDDHRVSLSVVDIMWNNSPNMDYRINLYAQNLTSANGYFQGLPNGLTSAKALAYNGNGLKYTSKLGSYFTAATAPGVIMNYSEVLFIKSEAALKGYIPGGDTEAENNYRDAIYASYDQFGAALVAAVPAAWKNSDWTADSLAADFYAHDNWTWDASYTEAEKMELIGTQKWAALFDQGLQSWFEWRRIGYPVLTPAEDGMNDGKIPQRVSYPIVEFGTNPVNQAAAISILGGPDDLNTRVWWDTDDNTK
jgi:hypothetical protein